MKGKRVRMKIADIKRRPMRQNSGTPEELKALARSWLERAVHDIIVCPSGITVDGHRRLEGLVLLGETEADVVVTEEELNETQIRQVGLTTAIHRADLSSYDKWQACYELLTLNPAWSQKELADHLHLDPSQVTRLLSPSKCVQEAQDALKAGKITISDAYAMSKRPEPEQAEMLAKKLAGDIEGRDALEQYGRKKRAAATPAVRTSKIKFPLPSGQTVTIAGDGVSLEDAIESLQTAIKAIKKAIETGLDAKTAQAVWRDMASVG